MELELLELLDDMLGRNSAQGTATCLPDAELPEVELPGELELP